MQRLWATVAAVWATIAIVGVLAWTHAAAKPVPQATPITLVVKGANGKQQLVVVPDATAGTSHATTRTSPAAASAQSAGAPIVTAAAAAATGAAV